MRALPIERVQREGAGKRVIPRLCAEAFPNGIEPDVPGDGLRGISSAKDMVVKRALPQGVVKCSGGGFFGGLFKRQHEGNEIAPVCAALSKDVAVVGHDTVGVDGKCVVERDLAEFLDQPAGTIWHTENGQATVATEGHKVLAVADVVRSGQADSFAPTRR